MIIRILLSLLFFYCVADALTFNSFIKYSCDPDGYEGDCRWSKYTQCFLPAGNTTGNVIGEIFDELGTLGCQIPRTSLRKLSQRFLTKELAKYFASGNNPVITRLLKVSNMSGNKCGGCGTKLRCCSRAANFFEQALDGEPCSDGDVTDACNMQPVTPQERTLFMQANPNEVVDEDPCNMMQYLDTTSNRDRYNEGDGHLVKTAFCSVFGHLFPSVNCRSSPDGRSCTCCCLKFRPTADGKCERDLDFVPSPDCVRDRSEWATCKRDSDIQRDDKKLTAAEKLRLRFSQFLARRRSN